MQRIVQLLPTVVYGDAVSNHALALKDILKQMGYESRIYAQNIGNSVKGQVSPVDGYRPSPEDVLIYHMSTGTSLSFDVQRMRTRKKIMIYHNITPSEFMKDYSRRDYRIVRDGRIQLKALNNSFDWAFGDSEYNCQELIEYGYKNVHALPILIPFKDYEKTPSKAVLQRYSDGITNIMFLGRIAPNKKQEDVIKTFYYYKKYMDPKARLFLVGSYEGMEIYYNALKLLVEQLDLEDVYFTGKVPFDQILAYYRVSDAFLCMSEHEGFCVPLIESMVFKVPIIAYNSSAIPYTLGDAGILINQKDYIAAAELLNKVIHDEQLRNRLIENGSRRLECFSYERTAEEFRSYMKEILGEKA